MAGGAAHAAPPPTLTPVDAPPTLRTPRPGPRSSPSWRRRPGAHQSLGARAGPRRREWYTLTEVVMVEAGKVIKELQGMRDDGHLSDALLRYAVRSIANADERYSWVGVYLLGENDELWLHNYVGEPTEHA